MNKFHKAVAIFLAILATFTLYSCRSSKVVSSWSPENTAPKDYHNIMVWAILPEKDSALRKQVETHLVNDLVSKGYHAISSIAVYQEKAYKKLSASEILNEFKSTGVDAVISIVLLKQEKENKYYQSIDLGQQTTETGSLSRYYSNVYERVFTPGYYITTTSYFWEANLFEVEKEKHMYSVQTRSFDALSTEELAHENGVIIMKDMLRKKILRNRSAPVDP
jgi:hypothetical protein